ncbi:kinesin light chain, putative [Talaromyces marneffei ATCC 18224]|uniref:Kinesin light chain, putative n=1 Tax=Talaromyces marneffei (strain ATCC 18224 / CBS 334.59 / QM 7333) TaxID=441960 RepID=B6Q529_TALMQ|nr:kinesin light chain, putative [Talaromyces marneffei ATCC 18224]
MPGMGKGSAAGVASSLQVSYTRIQVALMVGICGGAPYPSSEEEIFLGDVIISDSVIEYNFGRQYPGGFQRKTDVKDTLGRPNREIRALLAGLKASRARREFQDQMLQYLHTMQQSETKWCRPAIINDVLFEASYQHKHYGPGSSSKCLCFDGASPDGICEEALAAMCNSLGCNEKQIRRQRHHTGIIKAAIHIGTIASADTVMKSGEHRDHVVKTERVIGFEMEGAGAWDNVPCIIIKGVCDYADSHKNKAWQAYAAATGASAAKTFLEYWGPVARTERQYHWMVPFQKNSRFVGREKEIAKIDGLISSHNGPSKIAICGLGGIGKTQIALELAHRIRERDSSWSIFWISCTSQESVEQAYMCIAQTVGIQEVKPAEAKERVMAYLSQESAGKWLLIFDNADDQDMWMKDTETASALKKSLPRSPQGCILFTTRNRTLAVRLASPYVITASELDEETGLKMLEKSLVHSDQSVEPGAAVILLNQLALLPLAITQAAAYINENEIGLSTYVALLEEQESHVIELLSEDFEDDGRYEAIHNPIATTWWISFQQIQRLNTLAADYLSFMACVNPRDIPQSLLPQRASDNERIKAIGLLNAYSFISKQADGNFLSLHRLVHLTTRNWLRKNGQFGSQVFKTAGHLDETFPENDHTNRKQWREYLPHSLALMGEDEFQDKNERFIDLVWKVGNCLYADGRYNEAEKLFVQVMEIRKTVLGDEHPDTLTSILNLASTYWNQGQWNEAEKLFMQVMEIRKTVLGDEHPDTLTSMHNLAYTWQCQGKLHNAVSLMKECTDLRNKILGPNHPHSISSCRALNDYMDEYNALTHQIPLTGEKTPQTRREVSAGSSAAVVTTLSSCKGHINLSYPQRRSAATLFLKNHPLIIAARTPSPAPEGQNLQDVD